MIKISFPEREVNNIEAPNLTTALFLLKEKLKALNAWSILFKESFKITIEYELILEGKWEEERRNENKI